MLASASVINSVTAFTVHFVTSPVSQLSRMNITCDFSNNGTDCSHVFEGVHISITIFQAIFALVIFLLAFPMNILLITAMIIYWHLLDKTILVTISFLISNTILALISSQYFITSMLRAWIFGYWGCQVFAIITVIANISRCTTVGLVCIARFIKVFFPHSNQSKLLAGFLTGSWMFAFLFCLVKFFSGSIGFDVADPGCGVQCISWYIYIIICLCNFHRYYPSYCPVHYNVLQGKAAPQDCPNHSASHSNRSSDYQLTEEMEKS